MFQPNGSPAASDRSDDESQPVEETRPCVRAVRSEDLLRGGRELRIVHAGEVYRLLLTRNNKLILQK